MLDTAGVCRIQPFRRIRRLGIRPRVVRLSESDLPSPIEFGEFDDLKFYRRRSLDSKIWWFISRRVSARLSPGFGRLAAITAAKSPAADESGGVQRVNVDPV